MRTEYSAVFYEDSPTELHLRTFSIENSPISTGAWILRKIREWLNANFKDPVLVAVIKDQKNNLLFDTFESEKIYTVVDLD